MSDSLASGSPPVDRPDATLISPPSMELPTQSALSHPPEQTITGETLATAPLSTTIDVGSQLGPYKLLAKLGEGGMGAVYQARHTKLGKLVALKILPQHLLCRSDALSRFEREMLAVGSLQHPNIVQAHDAGEVGGVHYLSMEYVEGEDLQQFIQTKGTMSVGNACEMIRQAAQGLAAAHKLGLVHRDIKPSNLFVTKQSGQIKILDMGLALLAQEETTAALTTTGQCFGTPDYMAPEQWSDAHACDARSDLYSLGCTLYYLLTGRTPYHSDTHRSAANKMKGHVLDAIPDLVRARPDVPAGVVAIYFRLMAKTPSDRFASADELAAALAPWTNAQNAPTTLIPSQKEQTDCLSPSELSPSSGTHKESAPPGPPAAENYAVAISPAGRGFPPSRLLSRWLLAGGGAAVLFLLGVIIIKITHKDGTQTKIEVPNSSKVEITKQGDKDSAGEKTGWHGWPADAPPPALAPFDAEQAKQHQEAWAKYLNVPVVYTNSIGMKFCLIPPGEFTMGSTKDEIEATSRVLDDPQWLETLKCEAPQHKVILTRPFYLGMHEVTQGQYTLLMGQNPAFFSATGTGKDAVVGVDTTRFPVEMVSWDEGTQYCQTLSKSEQLKSAGSEGASGYRLPTEAEWEWACRAGTLTQFWAGEGEDNLQEAAWFESNSERRTHPVGERAASPFGLHDLHGNVWEWVQDGWEPVAYAQSGDQAAINPVIRTAIENKRMYRGGSWFVNAMSCRSACHRGGVSTYQSYFVGFRLALPVEAVRAP